MTNIDDIVIDQFENIPDLAGGSWAQHATPKGNDKANGRKHTVVAPFNGTVVRIGGEFNQIVIKSKRGKIQRICENATILPHVIPGYQFSIFEPLATDALFRQGQYKGTHVNGGDERTRYPYINDVTHTQEQARAIIAAANAPKPVVNTTSVNIIPGSNGNLRSRPVAKTETFIKSLPAGSNHAVLGYVFGEINENNPLWYVLSLGADGYPDTFLWSGITDTTNPIGLTQLQERPTLPEPEIVVPPKPENGVPPVEENNQPDSEVTPVESTDPTPAPAPDPVTPAPVPDPVGVDTAPIDTPSTKPDTINGASKLIDAIAALLFLTLPQPIRKKVYKAATKVGAIAGAIGLLGLSVAAVIGGEIGGKVAAFSGLVTTVSTLLIALATKLADSNT